MLSRIRRFFTAGSNKREIRVNAYQKKYSDTVLHTVLRGYDIALLRHLILQDASSNIYDQLLKFKPVNDKVDLVSLIREGANVNALDHQRNTPLMLAAFKGQLKELRTLLVTGAKLDARNVFGESAMDMAYNKNHMDCVCALMKYGAEIKRLPSESLLLKVCASKKVTEDLINMIIESGEDINALDDKKQNALLLLMQNEHFSSASQKEHFVQDPLNIEYHQYVGVIRLLIKNGIDVNQHSENGESALLLAACRENAFYKDYLKIFLDAGAKVYPEVNDIIEVARVRGYVSQADYIEGYFKQQKDKKKGAKGLRRKKSFIDTIERIREYGEDHEVSEIIEELREESSRDPFGMDEDSGFGWYKVFNIQQLIRLAGADSQKRLTGTAEYMKILNGLDEEDLGFSKLMKVSDRFSDGMQQLRRDFPNMSPFLEFVDKNAALSQYNAFGEMYLPPVLLVSKPGLGKTACVKAVAELLAVPFGFVDFSTVSANWLLTGSAGSWKDAKPGMVFDMAVRGQVANPLILCDEIDKVGDDSKYPPINVFYTLLEKDMMKTFSDEYIPELKFDASRMMFVATANKVEHIPEAILSRFHVIEIQEPSREQMRAITISVYKSIIGTERYEAFPSALDDSIVDAIISYTPREVKRALKLAFANVAYRVKTSDDKDLCIKLDDLELPSKNAKRKIGFVLDDQENDA